MSTSSIKPLAIRHWIACAAALAAAGCATQDQLRQSDVQHGQAVEALRADAGRSEGDIADLRAELRQTRDAVHALEVALAETRARSDAARAQADSAQATSREFLSNLVAVREEQRRQLDEGGVALADLRRKTADLDLKLQTQQRTLEQSHAALDDAIQRLVNVEAGLLDIGRRSGALEAKSKAVQEASEGVNRQLAALRKQVEDTRTAISSEGLLQLMRGLEDVRRNSASLRGSIDELQKAQSDAATQARNFYVDLDTRIRLLKQTGAAAHPAPAPDTSPAIPTPAPDAGADASAPPEER